MAERKMVAPERLACPEPGCNGRLLRSVQRNGRPHYQCEHRASTRCPGSVGCHPDGRALGVPGDVMTKRARQRAHVVFDRLWKEGPMHRRQAYAWLAGAMGAETHIAELDVAGCARVETLASAKLAELNVPPPKDRELLALTLWQPWGWCVTHAGKWIENRTWVPPVGLVGRYMAIHAGMTIDGEAIEDLRLDAIVVPRKLDRGAIIGVARVAGWVRCSAVLNRRPESFEGVSAARAQEAVESLWWAGPVGWVLEDVVAIPALSVRGKQGLWTVPGVIANAVRRSWKGARDADS